jgi:hypothetical protein
MAVKRPSDIGSQKRVAILEKDRHEGAEVTKNIEWKGGEVPGDLEASDVANTSLRKVCDAVRKILENGHARICIKGTGSS